MPGATANRDHHKGPEVPRERLDQHCRKRERAGSPDVRRDQESLATPRLLPAQLLAEELGVLVGRVRPGLGEGLVASLVPAPQQHVRQRAVVAVGARRAEESLSSQASSTGARCPGDTRRSTPRERHGSDHRMGRLEQLKRDVVVGGIHPSAGRDARRARTSPALAATPDWRTAGRGHRWRGAPAPVRIDEHEDLCRGGPDPHCHGRRCPVPTEVDALYAPGGYSAAAAACAPRCRRSSRR